jgi:amidohydrolase
VRHVRPPLKYRGCPGLDAAALKPRKLRDGTGSTCEFDVKSDAPVIALQAGIDALPVQKENDVECGWEVDGVAYACGHGAHTTVILGTGLFLPGLDRTGLLPGRVQFIFEPAWGLPFRVKPLA